MSKGLKITNEKSSVAPPTESKSAVFEKKATDASERFSEYKKRSSDLGAKFKSIMESSILPENKSSVFKDFESETLSKLIHLANDINVDEAQPEGTGSIALSQLIMKMMILQKDQNNLLKFKIEKLENEIRDLKIKLERNVAI